MVVSFSPANLNAHMHHFHLPSPLSLGAKHDEIGPEESSHNSDNLIIFGNGNVAKAVLDILTSQTSSLSSIPTRNFNTIYCTYRTSCPTSLQSKNKSSISYIQFNEASKVVNECSYILVTIPPTVHEGGTYADPILDDNENLGVLDNIPSDAWIGYVSTTGVYGNHNNSWVDESSPTLCTPGSKAFAYLDIERRWKEQIDNDELFESTSIPYRRRGFVFRCAGLYGDNFSALHTVLKSGVSDDFLQKQEHEKKGRYEGLTSRVHLEDVGRAIVASMGDDIIIPPSPSHESSTINYDIVNLADSLPARRSEVMYHANQLLLNSTVTVSFKSEKAVMSERRRRRKRDRKRVMNDKMRSILNTYSGLKYPSYVEGLKSILEQNTENWQASND